MKNNTNHLLGEKNFNKAILLVGGKKIGGAEKRFGRAFLGLLEKDENIFLIINQTLYENLIKHGILIDKSKNVILIKGTHYSKVSLISKLFSGFSLYCKVLRIIKKNNIIFLHSVGFLLLTNFLLFISLKKTYKGISIFDSTLDYNIDNFLLRFLFKGAIKRSNFIDFLSEDIKDNFLKKYGTHFKGKYLVSPCSFIDYSLFNPSGIIKQNSVVFMARLINDKNPFVFIDAIPPVIERLSEKYKDLKFYIVGEGPLEKALKEYSSRLGIEDYTVFFYAYNPAEILCRSRVFMSLQTVNNYPSQSLIEAMACENAIVATDVGETWKLVDESTGVRVKPNSQDIADAILGLFENPDKLKELGKNAREKVIHEHTVERFVNYLLCEVYDVHKL